jgi:hypothetical protein
VTRRNARFNRVVVALSVALVLGRSTAVAAGDPPKEDEWWKRGRAPRRHEPAPWSFGVVAGRQHWPGLGDLSQTPAQRIQGARGSLETVSPTYGLFGSFGTARSGGLDLAVDLGLDTAHYATTEDITNPPLIGDETDKDSLRFVRLRFLGRATVFRESRVQLVLALGLAASDFEFHQTVRYQGSPGSIALHDSSITLDYLLAAGIDVPFSRKPAGGWRARIELEVDRLGFSKNISGFEDGNPAPIATGVVIGIVYKHDAPNFGTHRPAGVGGE